MEEFRNQAGKVQTPIATLGEELDSSEKRLLEEAVEETLRLAGPIRRTEWFFRRNYVSVLSGVVVAALSAATYFTLRRRSR